mmetsp:Transcript_149143/g.479031  ORF Transcript_149143/g.479031 Transcript_149143/m.479031 type:complete len:252 (-) Transcript_149143:306-1061(-)
MSKTTHLEGRPKAGKREKLTFKLRGGPDITGFSNTTATDRFGSALCQTSPRPCSSKRSPALPAYNWFTEMAGLFKNTSKISGWQRDKSGATIRGDDVTHQSAKCARFISKLLAVPSKTNSPTPTSSRSGSFQAPGPAAAPRPRSTARFCNMLLQVALMSPLVRHMFVLSAHQGWQSPVRQPFMQLKKSTGRPLSPSNRLHLSTVVLAGSVSPHASTLSMSMPHCAKSPMSCSSKPSDMGRSPLHACLPASV